MIVIIKERTRIIKRLLQKGANKTLKDLKGRTPYDLAIVKNKTAMEEMLKDKSDCQLCALKGPLHKASKSYFNIILFYILHVLFSSGVFLVLLPCKFR